MKNNCKICKSKMPDELFCPALINGTYYSDLCPICVMALRNKEHGLDMMTEPTGEIAKGLVEEAWQYYNPVGKNIYGVQED